jgi:hypothetical protein
MGHKKQKGDDRSHLLFGYEPKTVANYILLARLIMLGE